MNARKLKTLIKVMQTGGVRTLKLEGVEITLDERFLALPEPVVSAEPEPAAPPAEPFTEEDILLWSAPIGMEQ